MKVYLCITNIIIIEMIFYLFDKLTLEHKILVKEKTKIN